MFFIRKWHLGRKQYAQADCYSNKVSLTCFIDSNNVGSVTNSNVFASLFVRGVKFLFLNFFEMRHFCRLEMR